MVEILLLTLKILVILFFIGSGFTYIFIPRSLKADAFVLFPWFGIILIAVLGVIFSIAKIPMIQAKNMILLVSFILLIYAVLGKKIYIKISKESFLISLFTVVTLLFNLHPLLAKAGFATTISLSNLDALSYTTVGDFLQNHTVFEGNIIEHYKPFLWSTGDLLHGGYRWGSPMILSFFSAIFGIKSYQLFSILITIFFALSFPLVYILAKKLSPKYSNYLLIFIFLTYSFNSTILYMLYNVFFAQFAFTGIYILIAILVYSYIYESIFTINFNSFDFLIAIAISSITSIYPESLIFVIFPLFLLIILNLHKKNIKFITYSIIKVIFLSFILNPMTAGSAIQQNMRIIISAIKPSNIGWENIPFAAPLEMIGFYNLYYSKYLSVSFEVIIGIPIVIVWLIGLLKSKSKEFFISYLAVFIPFYIGLRFIYPNFFSYHRAITYSLFIYSILFSIGIAYLLNRLQSKKSLAYILVFITLVLCVRSAYRTVYQLYWHPRIVDKSLVSLIKLNKNQEINEPFYTSDVFLGEYDLWIRLWREYFLTEKLIISMQNYPAERNYLEGIKLVLAEKEKLEYDGKKIIFKNIRWQNEFYQLGEIVPMEVTGELQVNRKL